jgi:hypothetical protein
MQTVVAEKCERRVDGPAGPTGIVSQASPRPSIPLVERALRRGGYNRHAPGSRATQADPFSRFDGSNSQRFCRQLGLTRGLALREPAACGSAAGSPRWRVLREYSTS